MESSVAAHTEEQNRSVARSPSATDGEVWKHASSARRAAVLARSLFLADLAAAVVAATIGLLVTGEPLGHGLSLCLLAVLLWPAVTFTVGLYVTDGLRAWTSGVGEVSRLVVAGLILSWPVFAASVLLDLPAPGALTAWIAGATIVLTALSRAGARSLLHRKGSLRQRALIVGSGVVAGQVADKLTTHEQFGLTPVGILDDDIHDIGTPDLPRVGTLSQLDAVLRELAIDRVIIAFSRASHDQLLGAIRTCRDYGVAVDVVPRLFEFLDGVRSLDHVAGLPLLSIGAARLSRPAQAAKRAVDLVISLTCLIVLSPLFLSLALAIRIESRGPVFFRQVRAGRSGDTFKLIKFRSMYADAEERKHEYMEDNDLLDGVMFKMHSDPRITRVGSFLRKTSLDELPQLINVLKGEMSLVGPRPLILPEAESLAEDWHQRRLDLRPGMTGPWQINGRSQTPFQEMLRFDYQYVAGWSLGRDIEILLGTVPAVLSRRGAY